MLNNLSINKILSKICQFRFYALFMAVMSFTIVDSFAQHSDIHFTHLTSQNGLSINRVTKIIQDKRGFIWIGTSNGLNLYDGYKFKVFNPDPSDSNSISNYSIVDMCEDDQGNIWVATSDGLNKYDWKKGNFYIYKHNAKDSCSLNNNFIRSLFMDNKGVLWVGTVDGLNRYDKEKNNFIRINTIDSLNDNITSHGISAIAEDKDGNIWLGIFNGLAIINREGKLLKEFLTQQSGSRRVNYMMTDAIFKDRSGNMWIGTNGEGLKKYNFKTGKFSMYLTKNNARTNLSSDYITSIFQDNLDNIWITTLHGLLEYNPRNEEFTQIVNDPEISSSLLSNQVFAITQDNSGIIWVGTSDGISKFFPSADKFNYYEYKPNSPDKSLISNDVISVFIDKNSNIWAGSLNGLNKIINNGKKIIHFKNEPGNPNSISSNFVRTVLVDHEGMVWIGTNMHGLNEYNPVTGKFKLFLNDAIDTTTISNNGVTAICETRSGNLWFGTWWGLNHYDRKTGKFKRYLYNKDNLNGIQANLIRDIYEDSKGMIWIGTDGGGLSELNPNTNKFTNFINDSTHQNVLTSNWVYTIYESKNGMLWIGTMHGLNRMDRNTGKVKVYTTENGLPGNVINAIEEDNNGCLWIGTDKGLSRFYPRTGKFINYTTRNGLKRLEFVQNVAAKDKEGRLYFGARGIVYFNPDSIKNEALTSPVVFTDLKIYNQNVQIKADGILKQSISNLKSISIPPGNNMITIEFSLLDYYDSQSNTYRYKLEGFDSRWDNLDNRNAVTFTYLPPGKYKLIVRATNNNGIKNEKEASLEINIIPAFYQTIWFKLLTGLLVLFIIVSIYEMRIRTIRKYSNALENKVDERTKDLDKTIRELNQEIASKDKFFSIIAHDLRSPFIALLGFSKLLVDEINTLAVDDVKAIASNILSSARHTFNLLENLLNWARIRTGRINFEREKVNLKKIFEEMSDLYRANTSNKDIEISFVTEDDLEVYADINMIQTVLRNIISNAIKFTNHKGKIKVSARLENNEVVISVADNGIGMKPEKVKKLFQIDQNVSTKGTDNEEGSGLGLILCKEFIELNKGRIDVKSKYGEGSTFCFTLPRFKEELQFSKSK